MVIGTRLRKCPIHAVAAIGRGALGSLFAFPVSLLPAAWLARCILKLSLPSRVGLVWWLGFCVLLLAVLPGPGFTQEESGGEASAPRRLPDVLSEGTLPIDAEMYLPDENGERVFVPNMTMQELLRLRELAAGGGSAFQFDSIAVDAVVQGESADVTGRFSVELGRDARSAEVPLRFGTCQLGLEKPEIESDPEVELDSQFLAEADGYRWILLPEQGIPEASSTHSITLKGKTRVTQEGDRKTLRIALPQHSCAVTVKLPSSAIDERVRAEDFVERKLVEDGVRLDIRTRGGDFSVSWRTREAGRRVASIEAQSQTTFTVGDPHDPWTATTRLTVRWFGSDANESFRIRLPERARWRTYPQEDFERFKISSIAPERDLRDGATPADQDSSVEGSNDESFGTDETAARPPSPGGDADATVDESVQLEALELEVVNLDPTQNQVIELPLEWEWVPAEGGADSSTLATQAPSLRLSDVSFHRGQIFVDCPNSYLVIFDEGESVELIQQRRLADAFGSQQLQFKFDQQDFNLKLRFRREQTLPTVRPVYHVAVDKNKLVMTAWLDCSFDGNQRPHELGMIFGNWVPQDNTARALPSNGNLFSDEGEVLRVEPQTDGSYRITRTEVDAGAFGSNRRLQQVWRIVAERAWQPDENALQFNLPAIIRGRGAEPDHGSGVLIVSSIDQILLQWQETPFRGLLSDSFSAEYERYVASEPARRPLAYRFQSQGDTPAWSGSVELLPQAIAYRENARVSAGPNRVTVQQNYQMQIANVPLEQPRFAVRSDATLVEPQFLVNGVLTTASRVQTLTPAELNTLLTQTGDPQESASSRESWHLYEIRSISPLERNASLTVMTTLEWNHPGLRSESAEASTQSQDLATFSQLDVPLARFVQPGNSRVLQRLLSVEGDYQVAVSRTETGEGTWDSMENGETLSLAPNEYHFGLRAKAAPDARRAAIQIDRSWLQTAVTNNSRQDRYVARFTTDASELNLRLPASASVRDPIILIDGREQVESTYRTDEDIFVVPLESGGQQERTIEVLYSVLSNLENWTYFDVAVPQILGAELRGRFYWQLATPRTQHLASPPQILVPEWRWHWNGLWWSRRSMRSEQELVQMLGASDARIPSSANLYLLSGQPPVDPFRVLVIARHLLWFPIGVFSILIATLVINYEFFRRPIAGMVLAAVIAGAAMAFPDLGVMLGQTAAISLGLVALVAITNAAIESRVRRRSVFTARPTTHIDGSGPFSAAKSSQATATTVPRQGSSIAAGGGKV